MGKKLTKKTKKQLINISFVILLVVITLVVVFVSQDFNINDVGKFLAKCDYRYIIAAIGGLFGYIIFEAISLHIIPRKLGHKSKFVSSVAYSSSDLYYSAITPSASGGQPASAYYMCRDGMSGGIAGFTVLLNIIGYTIATILVGLFAIVVRPSFFPLMGHWFAQLLVVIGFVIQFLLLAVLLLCLLRARIVHKIGKWGIALLAKIRIIKKPDKWYKKLDNMINKYRACRGVLKQHPVMFINVLLLNILQRVSQTLIPCFVIMAAKPDMTGTEFLELFCMQSYVLIGYNSIPLPGGTGVYEYLYPNIFKIGGYDMTFVLSAMMVSRVISYYLCMILCGIYTLVYHLVAGKKTDSSDLVPGEDISPDNFDILKALGEQQLPPLESEPGSVLPWHRGKKAYAVEEPPEDVMEYTEGEEMQPPPEAEEFLRQAAADNAVKTNGSDNTGEAL